MTTEEEKSIKECVLEELFKKFENDISWTVNVKEDVVKAIGLTEKLVREECEKEIKILNNALQKRVASDVKIKEIIENLKVK